METIKAQVRMNKETNSLELFYFERSSTGFNWVTSFCFNEGHNEACDDYRLNDCKAVDEKTAMLFCKQVEKYYNSLPDVKCEIKPVKRLTLS